MIPRSFPGIPTWHAYAGQPVKAADVQAILDWLKWFHAYFCPEHLFFSWDNGSYGMLSDVSSITPTPAYEGDHITFAGGDGAGSLISGSDAIEVTIGAHRVSDAARTATISTAYQSQGGPVYVDSWKLPPDMTE